MDSSKMSIYIERIYIDKEAKNDWLADRVIKALPRIPIEEINDKKDLIQKYKVYSDPFSIGKRQIFITHFRGRRLKPCPGTSHHICCGYYVINAITNCPMDCSYCVLQEYLNNPFLTLYSNIDELLHEIEEFISNQKFFIRLGTGELSDSLALESIFPISQILIQFFEKKEGLILELKTKSSEVEGILSLRHSGKTVVSWSLNPPSLIDLEEIGTAPFEERIRAAKRCERAGYPLGFHFDPIIYYKGWERDYQECIYSLFNQIDPKRVIWISLGGFRYPPRLKSISENRFPKTRIFLGELFPGRDGKFRYLRDIRVELYKKIAGWLKEIEPELFIYLCMESKEVWEEVFGWAPQNGNHLNQLFRDRVRKFLN